MQKEFRRTLSDDGMLFAALNLVHLPQLAWTCMNSFFREKPTLTLFTFRFFSFYSTRVRRDRVTTCWTKQNRNITWNFWLNHVQHLKKIEESRGRYQLRYFQNDLTLQRIGHQFIRSPGSSLEESTAFMTNEESARRVSSRDFPKWRTCFLATPVGKVGGGGGVGTCLGVIGWGPVMAIPKQKSN